MITETFVTGQGSYTIGDTVEVVKGRLVPVGITGTVVRFYYPRSYSVVELHADIQTVNGVERVKARFLAKVGA
jgi:hypothetical protein